VIGGAASVRVDLNRGGTAITFVQKYTIQVMTLNSRHTLLLGLGLFDQADDREYKNKGHRNLRCDTERAKRFDQDDLHKNKIDSKEETQ